MKDSKWNWRRASEHPRFFGKMGFFVRTRDERTFTLLSNRPRTRAIVHSSRGRLLQACSDPTGGFLIGRKPQSRKTATSLHVILQYIAIRHPCVLLFRPVILRTK